MGYSTHINGRRNRPVARFGGGFTRDTTEAELVGRVDSVGPEPSFLSGEAPALQTLGLTVTDVRRGSLSAGDEIDLDFVVVAGKPHVAIGASGLPALDPSMVQVGVLVQAWANLAGNRWRAIEISTDGPSSAGNNFAGRSPRPTARRR